MPFAVYCELRHGTRYLLPIESVAGLGLYSP